MSRGLRLIKSGTPIALSGRALARAQEHDRIDAEGAGQQEQCLGSCPSLAAGLEAVNRRDGDARALG